MSNGLPPPPAAPPAAPATSGIGGPSQSEQSHSGQSLIGTQAPLSELLVPGGQSGTQPELEQEGSEELEQLEELYGQIGMQSPELELDVPGGQIGMQLLELERPEGLLDELYGHGCGGMKQPDELEELEQGVGGRMQLELELDEHGTGGW